MTHHEIARCDCDPCRHARAARREFNGRAREPDMIRMLDSPYWRRTVAEPSRETVSALREETVAPKLRLYSDCPTGLCSTPISCATNSRCRALNAQARCQCSVPQGIGRICSWCGLPWRHG